MAAGTKQSEFKIDARDKAGRAVQYFLMASTYREARKKAKMQTKSRGGNLLGVHKKKTYVYRVKRGTRYVDGFQNAYSRDEVVRALESLRFDVQSVRRVFDFKGRAPINEIVSFVATSARLLEQKIAYAEVLQIMSTNVKNRYLRGAIKDIINDLRNGVDSREAFIRQGKVFGEHNALMLGIASKSGDMVSIFKSVSTLVERQAEFKKGLTSSLLLPAVTSLTLIGAIGFYALYLLPQMVTTMGPLLSEIPPLTQMTMNVSNFVKENYIFLLVAISAITGGFYAYILSADGKYNLHRYLIKVPYIGGILRNTSIEIFCNVLGIMYTTSGENIDAIQIAGDSSGNIFLARQIRTVTIPMMLKFGTELPRALEATDFFPEMVISRFRTAAETGDVKSTAAQLAEFYQTENHYALKNLTSIIEVSISILIMIAMVFLTYLSTEMSSVSVDTYGQ
jgi:type IV pilus assembly protein PilC